ncbi:hypothetical protein BZG02_05815 [Labilibaculum filiforme]|uniref:Uncharacterized protein n=1 Tax=Labilibaculum filiforme TaxID=1940526 RepID=A0A2N3I1Z4_9BACT|nr:hypothetical protein [Labilibaculum filiforme]PKQ64332.1 hypothetical protein BZG02_05815 [Labilibaculum filiforme]
MTTTNLQTVKAKYSINGQIIFSYTKLRFQKDLQGFVVPIIIIPILFISTLLNFYSAYRDQDIYEIIFFVSILVSSIVFTLIVFAQYKVAKTMDGKEFDFRDIKMIRIRESRNIAKLAFEFTNGQKHKMSIKKDEAYSDFFKNLNYANVSISTTKS